MPNVPLTMVYDPSGYTEAGSRWLWLKKVTSGGVDITDNAFNLCPVILVNDIDLGSRKYKEINAADKKLFRNIGDAFTAGFSADLSQADVNTLTFLSSDVDGSYYQAVVPLGISHIDSSSGKNMQGIAFYGLGQIEVSGMIKVPDGKTPKLVFKALPAPAAIAVLHAAVPTDIDDYLELDATAFGSLAFAQAINKLSQITSCKMSY